MTESYLQQFKQTQNFQVYRVTCDFFPLEKRHLQVSKGEIISGFTEENGWICSFKDVSPNHFGFVPKNYLKFEHQTNSQNVTPKSGNVPAPNPVPEQAQVAQVKGFLNDVYDMADVDSEK